ncbi:hypothetical protein [Arenimonas sp.]|uniref:hypothetical protein n=1 Tax=Arenimonas sp. TaxID=1872635 RepID=UPI0039E51CAF
MPSDRAIAQCERFVFLDNLQPATCDSSWPLGLQREGWLLSANNATPQMLALAGSVRDCGAILMADNGNWSLAGEAVAPFAADVDAYEAGDEVTPEQREALALRIADEADRIQDRLGAQGLLAAQIRIGGRWMVGPEDLGMVALLRAGVACDFPDEHSLVRERWRRTRDRFRALDRSGLGDCIPYMVLHAWDWPSANAVSTAATSEGLGDAVAVSLGVAMRSLRWIDSLPGPGGVTTLPRRLPEKYLRAVALVHGAMAGMRDAPRLHLLGAAAPILIAVLGLFAPFARALSIDSAAPVLDAQDGWLYGERDALLKMKREVLAARLLMRGEDYASDDPFFREFDRTHPQDWPALRRELGLTGSETEADVKSRVLASPSAMREYAPYLAPVLSITDPFCFDLMRARCGANAWHLQRICQRVRERIDDPVELRRWVESEVARYSAVADPVWAEATRQALSYAQQTLPLRPFRPPEPRRTIMPAAVPEALSARLAQLSSASYARQVPGPSPDGSVQALSNWWLHRERLAGDVLEYGTLAGRAGPVVALAELRGTLAVYAERLPIDVPLTLAGSGLVSRVLARTTYYELADAWNEGRRLRGRMPWRTGTEREVDELEASFTVVLKNSRRIALRGQARDVHRLAAELSAFAERLKASAAPIAAAEDSLQSPALPGLRVSRLIRQTSLMAAALPLLQARLGDAMLARTTRESLQRRERLRRLDGPPLIGALRLLRPAEGTRVQIRGRLVEAGWVELPEKPYGWAKTAEGVTLVLPRKRFENRGALPGAWIWAAGTVENGFHDRGTVVKVEAEGPSQHAGVVFFDWLADELRPQIDLYPGSLRLWWELPDPRDPRHFRDTLAHLAPR